MPKLYLMLGFPGAGKTTISKLIHDKTGAIHLWADRERHQRFKVPTHSHQENLQLYKELNQRTDELLEAGKDVIFDTNFNFYKDREYLRDIAAKHHAPVFLIWVNTPKAVAKKRAVEESENQTTRIWGNMDAKTFERISKNMQPPRADESYITIDGTDVTEESKQALLAQLA